LIESEAGSMQATMRSRPMTRPHAPVESRPWTTYVLLAAVILMMFVEIGIVLLGLSLGSFMYAFGLVPADFSWADPGTYFPLITFNFLHSSARHFATNAIILLLAGAAVEKQLGWRTTLVIWMSGGVASGILHLVIFPDSARTLVGASGAIAALIGTALVLGWHWSLPVRLWRGRQTVFHVPLPLVVFVWVGYQLYGTAQLFTVPANNLAVATWIHLGGFLFGAAVAGLLCLIRQRRPAGLPLHAPSAGD
jgi:membrane associated rhomboid family serine protease